MFGNDLSTNSTGVPRDKNSAITALESDINSCADVPYVRSPSNFPPVPLSSR